MAWQDHVGRKKQHPAVAIDRARIQNYAAGIADRNPRHIDASHPGYAAPPLVVATGIIPGTGSMLLEIDSGADLMRIVHGGIEISFERPIREGDALACTATFDGIADKGSGKLISFGFEMQDARGAVVSRGVTRYFVRGKKQAGAAPRSEPERSAPCCERREIVQPGQSLLYSEGSGDVFAIHTDPAFAKAVGLPDVILHGMCTLGFSTRHLIDAVLRGDSSRLRSVGVRFSKVVLHGDELTTQIWADASRATFRTVNQRGEVVLDEGTATFDVA